MTAAASLPEEAPAESVATAAAEAPAPLREEAPAETVPLEAAVKQPVEKQAEVEARPAPENRLVIGGVEFVRVPAGKFLIGSREDNPLAYDDEKPQHTLELPEFWMARFPVTNALYAAFLGKRKHPVKDWAQKKEHPVVNVSWEDARAYCRWFNTTYAGELKKHGLTVRLPTEAEWEKAARGTDGRMYPWGNEWDPAKANGRESGYRGTLVVGSLPDGASPYGVMDMAGNVWEWTADWYQAYPESNITSPYFGEQFRVTRGGGWFSEAAHLRTTNRSATAPEARNDDLGFRCAR